MRPSKVFLKYAAAFEDAYDTDSDGDWFRVAAFFHPDAEYTIEGKPPFAGYIKGRDNIIKYLKMSINGFDRVFEKRIPSFTRPKNAGDTVSLTWEVRYSAPGVEEFLLHGESQATVQNGLITRLRDVMPVSDIDLGIATLGKIA